MWCADVLWPRVTYSYFVQISSPSICCLRLEKALLARNGGHRVPAMFLCRASVVRITLSTLTRTLLLRYSPAPYCKSTMTSCKFIDRRGNVESDMACQASRSTPSESGYISQPAAFVFFFLRSGSIGSLNALFLARDASFPGQINLLA